MCGIAGFLAKGDDRLRQHTLHRMTEALRHRGPDGEGFWTDPNAGIYLGHRRLAVLDLSPAGSQPMVSPSGRYVLVLNGEVYNYGELRSQLPSPAALRGTSDAEVLLHYIESFGLDAALRDYEGMLAFALYDRSERQLVLLRDRMGEKPLYYGWIGDDFVFASELRAIVTYPTFASEINRDAIASYLRYSNIPCPHTIYRGVFKLPPGTTLRIQANNLSRPNDFSEWADSAGTSPQRYWDLRKEYEQGIAKPYAGTFEDAVNDLEVLLHEVVRKEMASDVPVGAFLSGGIDSSLIVALMQSERADRVKTFTVGFEETAFDESAFADEIGRSLGTDHTACRISEAELVDLVTQIPFIYDEPFADSSQIPTVFVSRVARSAVTVSLSGDGGDETFGGYTRYLKSQALWNLKRFVPTVTIPAAKKLLRPFSRDIMDRTTKHSTLGAKLAKLSLLLGADTPKEFYETLISPSANPSQHVIGASDAPTCFDVAGPTPVGADFLTSLMVMDSLSYLPNDILTKVDRATMSVSLESRAPLLHHKLVSFAASLPTEFKISKGQTKRVLRAVAARYVDPKLLNRPKMGFGVPLRSWLRGPLKEWASDLLDPSLIDHFGFLDSTTISRAWDAHISGNQNLEYLLWDVLMFQAWLCATSRQRRHIPEPLQSSA